MKDPVVIPALTFQGTHAVLLRMINQLGGAWEVTEERIVAIREASALAESSHIRKVLVEMVDEGIVGEEIWEISTDRIVGLRSVLQSVVAVTSDEIQEALNGLRRTSSKPGLTQDNGISSAIKILQRILSQR